MRPSALYSIVSETRLCVRRARRANAPTGRALRHRQGRSGERRGRAPAANDAPPCLHLAFLPSRRPLFRAARRVTDRPTVFLRPGHDLSSIAVCVYMYSTPIRFVSILK